MLKTILKILLIIVTLAMIVGLAFDFVWANSVADTRRCDDIKVHILNADSVKFISEGSILEMLHREGIYPEGKPISEVDLDSIESVVKNSEYIEEAQCVMMRNGDVHIYAKQLIPVLRVFSRGESYYVNKDGKKMKATSDIHTDLPVVIGNFSMASDALIVLPISKYVQRDATWNGIVTMYSVKDKNNIVIIPSIYGHVVNFGDSSNVENKFAKLRQFYREVMPVKGWNTYDTITLKWNHQIVANRRSKRIKPILVTDSVIDEEAPSIESISFERGN